MLETLQQWDATLFQFVNGSLSNPVLDTVLPWFREKWFWMPLYLFIASFALVNYRKKGLFIILGLSLSAGIADYTSSSVVKKNIQRLRPCNDPAMFEYIQRRVPCGGGYSFTSSHAANHFAAAVFLVGVFGHLGRWIRPTALGWAFFIAFAQVYVGVHYPGDVFFGALLGAAIGWFIAFIWKKSGLMFPSG